MRSRIKMNQPQQKISSGAIQLQRVTDYKIDQARALRRNMTPAEQFLWTALRGKKCGNRKIRRQQILDGFIADFFCAKHNLIIEVDGSIHNQEQQIQRDKQRRAVFAARGLREIRFRNDEVLNDIETVLREINRECEGN